MDLLLWLSTHVTVVKYCHGLLSQLACEAPISMKIIMSNGGRGKMGRLGVKWEVLIAGS